MEIEHLRSSKEDNDPILDFQNIDVKEVKRKKTSIAGVPFYPVSLKDHIGFSLHRLEEIRNGKSTDNIQHILPINPYNFFRMRFTKKYKDIMQQSFINLPAEKGMKNIFKIMRNDLPEIIPVSPFLMNLFRIAQAKNYTIYIVGSDNKVLDKLHTNLNRSFPELRITGKHHGNLNGQESDKVMESVRKTDPHILLLSLGFKKELQWVMQNTQLLKRSLLVNLGGSLSVMAGKKKPAPDYFIEHNSIWLWRMLTRPYLWYRWFILSWGYLTLIYIRLFNK